MNDYKPPFPTGASAVERLVNEQTAFDRLMQHGGQNDIAKIYSTLAATDPSHILAKHEQAMRELEESERFKKVIAAYDMPTLSSALQAQLDAYSDVERKFLQSSQSLMTPAVSAFFVPERSQIDALLATQGGGAVARWYETEASRSARSAEMLAELKSPWLRIDSAKRSLEAMAELQAIAKTLDRFQGFEVGLSDALRRDLGDWREPMDFAAYELADPDVRHEIYIAQGLKPSLVEFPEEAFEEGLSGAKLTPDELSKEAFKVLVPASADSSERTNEDRVVRAFVTLQRLERALRDFIDREMTKAHGVGWERRRLDPKVLADWKEKADKARAAGQPVARLIDFADFSHYTLIICRSDDFGAIFKPRFRTKENVRESFNRLTPLRHGIMHARVVTPSDSLFLIFESARLFKAIGTA